MANPRHGQRRRSSATTRKDRRFNLEETGHHSLREETSQDPGRTPANTRRDSPLRLFVNGRKNQKYLRKNRLKSSREQSRTCDNGQRQPHRRRVLSKPAPTRNCPRETEEYPGGHRNRPLPTNVRRRLRG